MEIFRLFGTVQVNKAKAIADLKAVSAAGKLHGGKLGAVFKKIGKVAKVAFTIASVAAAGIFVMAIKKAADFELGMAKVKAISGATAEEFADLTKEAKRLGLVTAQTMTDIATGMEAFARAGFDAGEIIDAMGGAVALAESQVMDLGAAVEITAAVLNGMRLPASESERVVNALAAAASTSATTVESLGESMKYLGPAAADLNIPLEEVLAIVGKLGDAGLRGGLATRAFATALNSMASPTEEATEVMEELDIAFFDAHGEFIGITGTVAVLEVALKGMTTEQKKAALGAMFTGAAVRTFSVLLGVGSEDLANYQEELVGTTTAFDQQAAMLDTLKGQWQILKGSIELLLVTIGTDMMPILKNLVKDRLVPIVNNMTAWIEKMGGLKGILAKLKGKIKAWAKEHEPFVSALIKAKDAMVGLWDTVVDAFYEIKEELGFGSDEADTFASGFESALTIAIDIVTALLGMVTSFVRFLADHREATIAVIVGIGAAFIAWKVTTIVASLASITAGLWGMATAAWAAIGPAGWIALMIAAIAGLAYKTIKHWEEIKEAGVLKWAGIIGMPTDEEWAGWASELWSGFLGLLPSDDWWFGWTQKIIDPIINGLSAGWDTVVEWFGGALDTLIGTVTSWMPGWMKTWLGVGEDAGQSLADGMGSQETTVAGAASDVMDAAIESVGLAEPGMARAGEDAGQAVADGIASRETTVAGAASDLADKAIRMIESFKSGMARAGEIIGLAVADGMGSTEEEIAGVSGDLADTAIEGIEESEPDMEEAGISLGTRLLIGFSTVVPEVVIILEDMGFTIKESLKTLGLVMEMEAKKAAEKAKEMVEEVEDEVKSFWQRIVDGWKNFWGEIVDGWKNFWDEIISEGKSGAEIVTDVLRDMWDRIKSTASNALGDSLNDIVDNWLTKEQKAKEHSDRMLGIEEDYNKASANLQDSRQDNFNDAELAYQRKVEDIEEEYRRALQNITSEDTEERERIETRYRENMEDAATTYARRREDIETDYSDAVIEQEKRREQAIEDEKQAYEESKQTIWEILKAGVLNFLSALRQELLLRAAFYAVEAAVQAGLAAVLAFTAPAAAAVAAAKGWAYAAAAAAYGLGAAGLAIGEWAAGGGGGGGWTPLPPGTEVPGWTPAAAGGLAVSPAYALIGEGRHEEALLPLNAGVYAKMGAGIAEAMTADMRPVEVNVELNIDHLTADDPRQIDELCETLGRRIGFRLRGLGLEAA